MAEEKNTWGGARAGSGRKKGVSEEKIQAKIVNALKDYWNVNTEDEAMQRLIQEAMQYPSTIKYLLERLFGRPKIIVDQEITVHEGVSLSDQELLEQINNIANTIHEN